MSLRRSLRGHTEFTNSLNSIRERAERIWAAGHHVFFTGHDVAHSERIIDKLDDLCSRAKLNVGETYVLLAATYLHDIGMQWHETTMTSTEIRERHHLLGADWIVASARPSVRPDTDPPPLGVIPGYADYIALLVRGHRDKNLGADDYRERREAGDRLRIRLLTALLQWADELDLDWRRVDLDRLTYNQVPAESQVHWFRHAYIADVHVDPSTSHIQLHWRFPPDQVDECRALIADPTNDALAVKLARLAPFLALGQAHFILDSPTVDANPTARSLTQDALARLRTEASLTLSRRQADLTQRTHQEASALDALLKAQLDQARALQVAGEANGAAAIFVEVGSTLLQRRFYREAASNYEQGARQLICAEAMLDAAHTFVSAGRAFLAAGDSLMFAEQAVAEAEAIAADHSDPALSIALNEIRGQIAAQQGDNERALSHFLAARAAIREQRRDG